MQHPGVPWPRREVNSCSAQWWRHAHAVVLATRYFRVLVNTSRRCHRGVMSIPFCDSGHNHWPRVITGFPVVRIVKSLHVLSVIPRLAAPLDLPLQCPACILSAVSSAEAAWVLASPAQLPYRQHSPDTAAGHSPPQQLHRQWHLQVLTSNFYTVI